MMTRAIVLQKIKKNSSAVWQWWNQFWFESASPAHWTLFRAALGLVLLGGHLIRTLDLELLYSESGIMPLHVMPELLDMKYRWSLLTLFPSTTALWIFNSLFLASLVTLTLGIFPRLSAIAAYVLHVSIIRRNMAPTYGFDLIAIFFLLYLCLAEYKTSKRKWRNDLSSVGLRLVQLQVCIIYAYSGLDKARGPMWWAGESLWGVLANPQLTRFDFTFFAQWPLLVVIFTYSTLAWEIYFPVLVWSKTFKNFMLLFGVALHVGIALMINIPFFGLLMIVSYIVFLDNDVAKRWANRLSKLLPKRISKWNESY